MTEFFIEYIKQRAKQRKMKARIEFAVV